MYSIKYNFIKRILIVVLFFALFTTCSKDENNPVAIKKDSDGFLWVHFQGDSIKIEFKDLAKIDADGEQAIQLDNFIDTNKVDINAFYDKNDNPYETRVLYAYRIVGDDGFSASAKGYPDNTWEQLQLGHIMVDSRNVIFPDDKIDLAGAYNVKESRHIHINRKFDVTTPDTTVFVKLNDLNTVTIPNHDNQNEQAVQLKDVVTTLTATPENHTYNFSTIDNFGPSTDLTWEQFQTGYWLLDTKQTIFTDTTLVGSRYKLKVLEKILVK